MAAYDLIEIVLKISLVVLGILLMICMVCQIVYYITLISDHIAEDRERKRKEAEKIAKNIYGED